MCSFSTRTDDSFSGFAGCCDEMLQVSLTETCWLRVGLWRFLSNISVLISQQCTAFAPWVRPLQSGFSTAPQRLGCFRTTNWKCFPASWSRCSFPFSSFCSSLTRRRSSGPWSRPSAAAYCALCCCSVKAWWPSSPSVSKHDYNNSNEQFHYVLSHITNTK